MSHKPQGKRPIFSLGSTMFKLKTKGGNTLSKKKGVKSHKDKRMSRLKYI